MADELISDVIEKLDRSDDVENASESVGLDISGDPKLGT